VTLAFPLVSLLFVFSGMAGLILQTVWTRQLALVFGSTLQSASTTVAAFMLGLGLGAWLAGRQLSGRSDLLRLFGLLELTVAASSALVTWLIPQLPPVPALPARFALTFGLLLLPTTAMGATLPLLTQYFVSRWPGHFARVLGTLYTTNTLGAACGALATDFVFVRSLGVWQTAATAIGFDALVGLGALVLSTRFPGVAPAQASAGRPLPGELRALLALTGFASLALEIVWMRLLVFFNKTDIYSFAIVLACYLAGVVLGSALVAGQLDRRGQPAAILAVLLGLTSWSVLATLLCAPLIPSLKSFAATLPLGFDAQRILVCTAVLLGPAALLGTLFPTLSRVAYEFTGQAGATVGEAYGWNALGCILGSLGAGFVFIPQIGLQGSLLGTSLLFAAAGWALAWRRRLRLAPWLLASLVLLAGACLAVPRQFLARTFYGAEFANILYLAEDHYGSVALLRRWDADHLIPHEDLVTNGFSMMSNELRSRRYATMLAAVPCLVHPQADDVLVVCLGLANSLTAAAQIDRTKRVDCVELSPVVARAVSTLDPIRRTLESPKVHLTFADGRNYLRTTERTYDVITAEPPPPAAAGVVNLYSRDYFELCRRRLKPGGIVSHWLPVGITPAFDTRTILRAFAEVFPYVYLWEGADMHLCLLGSDRPLQVSYADLQQRLAANRGLLGPVGLDNPELFTGAYLLGREGCAAFAGDAPPLTDNHPYLQYVNSVGGPGEFLPLYARTEAPPVSGAPDLTRARRALQDMYMCLWGSAPDFYLGRLMQMGLARAFVGAYPDNPYLAWVARTLPVYEEHFRALPPTPENLLQLARIYFIRGQDREAAPLLARVTEPPRAAEMAQALLAVLQGTQRQFLETHPASPLRPFLEGRQVPPPPGL